MTTSADAQPDESRRRQRVLLALSAAVLLAGLIAAVLVVGAPGGSGDGGAGAPAPEECLREWNRDEAALSYGRHNRTFHRYTRAQVGYMPADGSAPMISDDRTRGECAIVFARDDLDPEIVAAGQVQASGTWIPLSRLIEAEDLATMQREAFGGANAQPTEEGKLAPL